MLQSPRPGSHLVVVSARGPAGRGDPGGAWSERPAESESRSTLTPKQAQVRVPPPRRGTHWPQSVRWEFSGGFGLPGRGGWRGLRSHAGASTQGRTRVWPT